MTNNEPVQMITRIPADLRDRIKAHAALERMSMNELVARVMDAAVLRDLESVRQAAAINDSQPAVKEALARVNSTHPLTPAEAIRLLVFFH